MKILGDTSIRQRTVKVLIGLDEKGEPRELVVRPVKFGKLMEIDRDLPEPVPPSTGEKKKDPKTGQPLRRNGQYLMIRDEEDPKYQQELSLRMMAVNVATVVAALGDQVDGLRERSDEHSPQQHWLLVLDDFADLGVDQGIMTSLIQAALTLSEPMNNLEILLMKQALGTDKETDAVTDEKVREGAKALEKAEAQGKA